MKHNTRWKTAVVSEYVVAESQNCGVCWSGEAASSKWEGKDERCVGRRGEPERVRASTATTIPQEILLNIVECVAGTRPAAGSEVVQAAQDGGWVSNHPGLSDLALVCRAWYQLIAPELYSKLEVVISAEFGLCSLQNKTAQHARRVLLRGTG